MPLAGVAMLVAAAALMALSGLPAYVALLLVSVAGAVVGMATGAVEPALLGALPGRIVGLLEQDLLQAVPLFVLVGALLDGLPLAGILYRCGWRVAGRGPAAPRLAALGLGALLAPMNGSVGASASMLSRVVAPRLRQGGTDAEHSAALVAVGSTLGVLVPPSLVLLLLGDALMRAHTEALQATGRTVRIINTQDLLHGAMLPALIGFVAMMAIAAWQARGEKAVPQAPVSRLDVAVAAVTVAILLSLLGGVAAGRFYAVEAAATGGLLLFATGLASRQLTAARLKVLLHEALALSGSLLALFLAATTFTLLLRAFGTDRWVEEQFALHATGPSSALALGLGTVLVCGLVLDAFELVFVVVPVLMPAVLARVDDAAWAGVLVLLALQISFLVPPLGYAVAMASSLGRERLQLRRLARALAPYLAAQVLLLALVAAWPALVHFFDPPPPPATPVLDNEEVERLLRGEAGGREAASAPD